MTSKEYKENFRKFPERAWLSSAIYSLRNDQDIEGIAQYLSGEKDITAIDDIAELNKIRFHIMKLRMYAEKCVELIDEMNLDIHGEFEDMRMELHELGISKDDVFECTESFNLLDMMDIDKGSQIQVIDFQSAGSSSQFACKFINWVRNDNMKRLFPNGYDSMFIIPVSFMDKYLKKK